MIHPARLWNEIPGFDSYYASIYGEILSMRNRDPVVLKQSIDSKGYWVVNVGGRVRRVHRLVGAAFLGLNLDDPSENILHIDDDPKNNNIYNLRVGTHAENMQDMHKKGRHFRPAVKISDDQVRQIRKRLANGERGAHLAKEFNVSSSYMSFLRSGSRRVGL